MENKADQEPEKHGLKEPMEAYPLKRIFFSTLAEQEEGNYRYWLSLTPEQRLENATTLIRHIFADQLQLPRKTNRIIFDHI